ncbi:MAG: ribonuclease III [Proteobacteria bacterium]|nr:ribonuclease III [Pseudomonadota bacterium]
MPSSAPAPAADEAPARAAADVPTAEYEALIAAIGYDFVCLERLRRALTHRSRTNEEDAPGGGAAPLPNNERLEFLGDAVVDLVVSHALMGLLPEAREGELSRLRATVVNEGGLAEAAQQAQLGAFLRLGRGEEQTGGRQKASILADAMEAVIGAVFLDGGLPAAEQVIARLLGEQILAAAAGNTSADYKTRLQEWTQARQREVPRYDVINAWGPDHDKVFEVAVSVAGRELAQAAGTSKKEAQQRAAELALSRLAAEEVTDGPRASAPKL